MERLERRVEELADQLSALSLRVDRLVRPPAEIPASPAPASAAAAAEPADDWTISRELESLIARHGLVFLAGNVSLVLAGAMVLRLVTMSTPISLAAGASLGLVYCGFLLFVAERRYRAGAALHGDTFAILSIFILDTLLAEATHRAGGLPHGVSYAVLAASLVVLTQLAVTKGRSVPFAAGLVAAPVVGVGIGGAPFLHPLFAGILMVTVLASAVAARRRGWRGHRWWPAVASLVYLALLCGIAGAAARRHLPMHVYARPPFALPVFAGFFLLFVAPPTLSTVFGDHRLDAYEITTAVGGAVVCFGGVAAVLTSLAGGIVLTGLLAAGFSLLFYLAAGICYSRHGAESGSFYTLSAIAFLAALTALPVLVGVVPALGAAGETFALVLAFFAARLGKRSLSFQAHILTFAAFGVLLLTAASLTPPVSAGAASVNAGVWLVVAGVVATAVFERLRSFVPPGSRLSLTRLRPSAVALVSVFACGILEVLLGAPHLVYPAIRAALGSSIDPAAVWHTLITLFLVAGGLVTLVAGVRLRQGEVVLLAAVLMIFAGIKLALFDAMRVPGHYLVLSWVVFGLVLLVSSVLYRRTRGLSAGPGGSGEESDAPERSSQ